VQLVSASGVPDCGLSVAVCNMILVHSHPRTFTGPLQIAPGVR